jgi:hypothetical protein
MRKSYSQRILSFLATQEQKNGNAVFNRAVAKKRFRKVDNIDGSVMRRAREMATSKSNKMLKRVSTGEYALTAKGRRAVSA